MAKTAKNPLQQSSWSLSPRSLLMGVFGSVVFAFVVLTGFGIARPLSQFVSGIVGNVTGLNTTGDSNSGPEVL